MSVGWAVMADPVAPDVRTDRHLSGAEALMWQVERDPALRSSFSTVTFLDRPPDAERLRRRMLTAVATIPRLHRRVVSAPAGLGPPAWADDPDFDIAYHVRRVAL